jgi:cytochrome c oxidase subunit 2
MAASMTQTNGSSSPRPYGRLFVIWWLVISVIATPLVVAFIGPLIPPGNHTVQAAGQVFDNEVLIGVSTPICAFILLFLVFTFVLFSNRSEAVADGVPLRGDARIQIVWMVVTTTVVLSLAVFGTWELINDGSGSGQGPSAAFVPSGSKNALDVQVLGQQWEFTYRYPSAGGIETSELMLPANTLIRFHVTSLDVIHSFWAYELGVKADANPGTDDIAYVQTKGPLTFHIRCAELCGLWHGYMFDTGQVVDSAQFTSWLSQQRAVDAPIMKYLPPYATTYQPDPQLRAG